jgi:hypothetical protein
MGSTDLEASLYSSETTPGYYRLRLTKGGPWVAAHVAENGSCTIGGKEVDLTDGLPPGWPWHPLDGGKLIYDYMIDNAKWCASFDRDDPRARPRNPVDIERMRPPF